VSFVDDFTITRLAGEFRGRRAATDVLSFTYGDDALMPFGEIIISVDTAKRQSAARGLPLADELLLLIVHGILHVGGQGDESPSDWKRMRIKEFNIMSAIVD